MQTRFKSIYYCHDSLTSSDMSDFTAQTCMRNLYSDSVEILSAIPVLNGHFDELVFFPRGSESAKIVTVIYS